VELLKKIELQKIFGVFISPHFFVPNWHLHEIDPSGTSSGNLPVLFLFACMATGTGRFIVILVRHGCLCYSLHSIIPRSWGALAV
jgi:hypothetical protein